MENLNKTYFNLLKQNLGIKQDVIKMFCPQSGQDGNVIPYSISNQDIMSEFNVTQYNEIKNKSYSPEPLSLNIIKMQAGLGSSVKRDDVIKTYDQRYTLGAKCTDLFLPVDGKYKSISELQLIQAIGLEKEPSLSEITYTNLVNEETKEVVNADWKKTYQKNTTYNEYFSHSKKLHHGQDIFQEKMPTIGQDGELTTERMAPAGHGFIGIRELVKVFNTPEPTQVTVIGNGEDLNSTPELPLIHWVVENDIPVVMITTTKTKDDLKGGQISLLNQKNKNYLTIVEKAQAEQSNQLQYFEDLGLREGDRRALFNTNIVIINEQALKKKMKLMEKVKLNKFLKFVSPDVISNVKEQNGKSFTQLESALGSVMLNLDRFFRREFNEKIVSIVNIDTDDRERFFIPIKKREDYDCLLSQYEVDINDYRLVKR